MIRYNALMIRPNDDQFDNADLITLLYKITDPKEIVFNEVRELKTDDVFFIEPSRVVPELFKHVGCFEWIRGSVKLWCNNKVVTRFNYRTAAYREEDEPPVYSYLNWEEITSEQPITKETL